MDEEEVGLSGVGPLGGPEMHGGVGVDVDFAWGEVVEVEEEGEEGIYDGDEDGEALDFGEGGEEE